MQDLFNPNSQSSCWNTFHTFTDWIASYKAVPFMWNGGYALGSDNPKISKFLKKIERQNELKIFFDKFEYSLSKYGAGVIWFDSSNQIRMANPIFPIYASMDGELTKSIQCVETNKGYFLNGSFKLIEITEKGISTSGSLNPTLSIGFILNEQDFKNKEGQLSKYEASKGLNGVYCLNVEKFNPMIINLNFRTTDHRLLTQKYYDDLKLAMDALIEDIIIAQSKIITYKDDNLEIQSQEQRRADILKNIILRSQRARSIGGKEVGTEFLHATPNSATLWQGFHTLWDFGVELCGYSSIRSMAKSSTATGERFSKDLDLTTSQKKRATRESQLTKLFDRMLIENDLWDGENFRPYYFKIFEGEVNDKEEGLNRTKQLEDFGYISHYEAIQRMFPNFSIEEAKAKAKEIIDIQVEILKKSQDAMTKAGLDPSQFQESSGQIESSSGSFKSQEQKLRKPDEKTSSKQKMPNSDGEK